MSKNFQNFPDSFESALLEPARKLLKSGHRAVLAVSGGADSTALLTAFARISSFLCTEPSFFKMPAVIHVDHGLRGAESDGDAEFVRRLAARYGLDFRLARLDPARLAQETKEQGSLEAAARLLRYERLSQAALSFGARYILTAHHLGDFEETILLRLFRGSGWSGLTGIPPIRPLSEAVVLVRPFLKIPRAEICAYLDRIGETFRTDSSNASPCYTRNRIRNELMPLLESIFPNRWEGALLRLSEHAQEVEPVIAGLTDSFERLVREAGEIERTPAYTAVPVPSGNRGEDFPDPAVREFFRRIWTEQGWPLREMGKGQWSVLAGMMTDKPGTVREFPGSVTVRRTEEKIILMRRPGSAAGGSLFHG